MQSTRHIATRDFAIRDMVPCDVGHCIWIRTHTRELCWTKEALAQVGVTEDAVVGKLSSTHKGWVADSDGQVVGFCMVDQSNGEFWVIALLPEYEGHGIGRQLLQRGQDWLHEQGWPEIWLWPSPNIATRAYKLYLASGWRDCGVTDGQRIMRRRATPEGE